MTRFAGLLFALLGIVAVPAQGAETASAGDVVVHFDVIASTELTPEAAAKYNITPAPNRAVLTIDPLKHGKPVPAQVYAGAINSKNYLINVPIREKLDADGPRYLGEFYILPSDNLTFIVNVNVLGTPLKARFNRSFSP